MFAHETLSYFNNKDQDSDFFGGSTQIVHCHYYTGRSFSISHPRFHCLKSTIGVSTISLV